MSRPSTRSSSSSTSTSTSKNKRHNKHPSDSDPSSHILRNIHSTGHVSPNDIRSLYMFTKPVCHGCRVNTRDNPNCFCGLVPPLNGTRKSGLWQKTSDILQALGPDPSTDLRPSPNTPAGLTNLGATCYANSILQFLYMNLSFRQGLFSVEPDVLKQQPVLDQLARLFAQLHASQLAFIDSAPFIKTLELDNAVQQDSHEFLTLLLSLLERCLMHSTVPRAKTIVQDLFRGSVSNVIKCSKCGKDSEASAKMEDFYELELNVKGLKGLDGSLDDYLGVEELCGDNQYFCESCATRVDATRSIKLWNLPDVLIFQLKRYVFHAKTSTKKKITSAFCFPRELDMRKRLSEHSHLDWLYDLSAVLIHKGSGANSGHYIAHIKDENTGQWWEFDDEHVSSLGNHAFGEGSSGSTAKSAKDDTANGNRTQQPSNSDGDSQTEIFSSTDAYMLMYNRRRGRKDHDRNTNVTEAEDHETSSNDTFSVPSHLFEDIKNTNASYLDACQQYKMRKDSELNCITERRQEVRGILSEAPAQSLDEPFFWVSTDWLRQWADNITPPFIDNNPIQCLHGKVPVSKVSSMKRLSAGAWIKLFSKYNGGPTLTKDDYCLACIISSAKSLVSADSYRDRRMQMRDLANSVILGTCLDGKYYVSRPWLLQWVRRKNLDAPCEADAGPTVSITCPHGQLMPEQAPGAKRILVPENLWLFFYEDSIAVKTDDPIDSTTFPLDSDPCPQCNEELSEVACMEDSLRAVKLKQRKNHEKLAMGKNTPLSLESNYYLLPSSWVANWRNYVNASGKASSSLMEPQPIDLVIDSLKCEKHARLIQRPPDLVCKRGTILQKSSITDGLTIISEDDWNSFCEEWGGDKEKGISLTIAYSNTMEKDSNGSCEEMLTGEENPTKLKDEKNDNQTKQPIVRTFPEVCEDCIGERESCELVEKLNYCDEDINVTFVRGKEAPKSFLEAADNSFEPDRRASKRSRRTSNGNSVNLKVSGSTSLYQLKMMIWESLGVIKENQILRKGPRLLDQESATLADMNIFPGDKLWVQDSEIHEHRDIADELSDQKADAGDAKEGFHGTLLSSDASSQLV